MGEDSWLEAAFEDRFEPDVIDGDDPFLAPWDDDEDDE